MVQLGDENIRLKARARDKEDAIRQAGLLLAEAGYIEPGYVRSMLGREGQANTYLGNGIAIPHGMLDDRELIRRTGISVIQLPDGVEWNPGDVVHLVIGIAARSDEHLQILANLTDVLDDPDIERRLAHTDDPAEIAAVLNRTRDLASGADRAPAGGLSDARHVDVTLLPGPGLHARPATHFVDIAQQYESEIQVQHDGKVANGKAMASLLKLGVEGGGSIRILARGPDEEAALRALREAVEAGLGDAPEAEATTETYAWTPASTGKAIAGVAASPGLAIGPLYQLKYTRIVVSDTPRDRDTEQHQLQQALETARQQLGDIYEDVRERAGKNEAAIFRAHLALLDDPDLRADVRARVDAGHSAAWSWQQAIAARVADVQKLTDVRLAARAVDLHDIGQRVLRVLAGTTEGELSMPDGPVIVAADDLTPSDTARLDPKRTLGVCTVGGGPTSHTAIIARSLDIPAIVAAGPSLLEVANGTTCILDGGAGMLFVEPTEADLTSAKQAQAELLSNRDREYQTRYQPALMTDGHRVEVVANIGQAPEAAQAVEAGGEGVGLLRTEFLFLGRGEPPSEEEQFAAYTEMTRALNGLPLIIRTLDIGGDKELPYLPLPPESNPFLGVRGIRVGARNLGGTQAARS